MLNVSERRVVFLVGAVQFVNVLDFTMVMPLGPDFARALHISTSQLGNVTAGYGPAAALAGLAGSFFLDRFDRRRALAVAMLGLVAGTLAGGLASDLGSLVAARVIAGAFGGPATSIAYAIIADVIPPERRGKAMGAVMTAFSVAQVIGVPTALFASQWLGWRAPFFGVAALGLVVALGAVFLLPSLVLHLASADGQRHASLPELLSRPTVWASYAMTATVMASGFILIPNLPSYVQRNLGFPRAQYGWLTFAGGIVSFATLRVVGPLVDRYSSLRVTAIASVGAAAIVYFFFVRPPAHPPVVWIYVFMGLFMVALGSRNVAYNALTSKVPRPRERARFLSIQSTVYHAVAGTSAWLSTTLLGEGANGALTGVARVALISIALGLTLPFLVGIVEARVRREATVPRAATERV
jgi:predicted MFS family arabinose efflux permease